MTRTRLLAALAAAGLAATAGASSAAAYDKFFGAPGKP